MVIKAKKNISIDTIENSYLKGITINENVLNIAKELKKKGYKIYILSNEAREWMEYKIRKFKLDKIFEKVYCSAFLGISKPDPEIFKKVLSELKIGPQDILFIDNQEKNIEVAKSLGIKTILFTSPESFNISLL